MNFNYLNSDWKKEMIDDVIEVVAPATLPILPDGVPYKKVEYSGVPYEGVP